ncbi:MAG: dTDP-4-dehydrorhamnose reductase [Fimbriimonadales bacterium]|nr:MAG: NAD(P)-dependent oxidoreductase [Fimbriimonadales bacterium]
MRALITGASGLLGAEVVRRFREAGWQTLGAARSFTPDSQHAALDITDPDQTRALFDAFRPEVVVHCAAMTHVDACERDPQEAYRVNAFGAEVIAANCQRIGAACVYISTDYVFDGVKRAPYHEYDTPNPISVYGRSKYLGEQAVQALCPRHYIARVAWLYGVGRKTFPQFVLEGARQGQSPTVIADQIGSPTYVADVAEWLRMLIPTECYGVYHLTNPPPVSRYEFACALLEAAGLSVAPTPLPMAHWQTPAPRPAYSALISWRLRWAGLPPMPPWRDAMRRFLRAMNQPQ